MKRGLRPIFLPPQRKTLKSRMVLETWIPLLSSRRGLEPLFFPPSAGVLSIRKCTVIAMTDHRLLADDGSVEETTFGGGVTVTLDRNASTVTIRGGPADTGGTRPVATGEGR
jgi:hypothetical protein